MSSLLLTEMRRTYAAQRGVSQGAAITLMSVSGGYAARFECAERCAQILGDRSFDRITNTLFIPTEDVQKSLAQLAETFSIALLDTVTDDQGTRFVLVWKIAPTSKRAAEEAEFAALSAVDLNQGNLNLDEY